MHEVSCHPNKLIIAIKRLLCFRGRGKAAHRVKTARRMGGIFARCASDKRLISRRHKELQELNNERSDESISRLMRQADRSQKLGNKWPVNGKQTRSISSTTGEMQMKTALAPSSLPVRTAIPGKQIADPGEGADTRKPCGWERDLAWPLWRISEETPPETRSTSSACIFRMSRFITPRHLPEEL